MANSVLISESILQDVASAIKTKKNYSSSTTLKPYNFASEISSITSGGITPTGSTTITTNGTHDVTNYATAVVNVPTSGGGGSSSYTISITNADSSHQYISPSYNGNTSYSSIIYSSDSIQVNPAIISLQLVANTGYNAGTIIVDGVDSNSQTVTLTAANHTITTTNATVRDSTYIMNASITVGYDSSSQKYSTTYGSISNGSAEYEQYGSTVRINLIYVDFGGGSSSTVSGYYQVYIGFDGSLNQITPTSGVIKLVCGTLNCSKDISGAWLGNSIYGESSSGDFTGDSFDDIINYSITNNIPITVRIEDLS